MFLLLFAATLVVTAAEPVSLTIKSNAASQTFATWTQLATADGLTVACKSGNGCRLKNKDGDTASLSPAVDMATSTVTFTFKTAADLAGLSSYAGSSFVLQMNKADLTEQFAARIGASGYSTDKDILE